jgi:hypothetical protein
MESCLTFILPTVGRTSLYEAIQSLLQQTNTDWRCILVLDEAIVPLTVRDILDERFILLNCEKQGEYCALEKRNCAGKVRNEALHYLQKENTEQWVAFLDDDDILSTDYIECFYHELELCPSLDVILFRMQFKNGMVLPPYSVRKLQKKQFGISFCFRMKENMFFINDPFEDYIFMKCMEYKRYKMVISPFITYYVRFTTLPENVEDRNEKRKTNHDARIYLF